MPDTPDPGFRVGFVRDEAAFSALEPAWRALEQRCGAAQSSFCFAETWRAWALVAKPLGARLAIAVGRVGDEVVLIWPLVRRRGMLEALCGNPFGPNDLLLLTHPRAGAWMTAAWEAVRRDGGGRCLVLRGVPEGSALQRVGGVRRRPLVERATWLIRLADWGSWERYETHLPRRLVMDQRRQWRRVAAMPGEVRFRRAGTREEAAAALDAYAAMKGQWFEERGITARLHDAEPYRAFERANLLALFEAGQLLIGRLGAGTETLSVGYGIVRGERFLFEGFAYNAEFARLSPSRLVLEQLVRWCFERRLEVFDLSPGDDIYKTQWADARGMVFDAVIPLNACGRVVAWHHGRLRQLTQMGWLRAAYRRLPKGLREAARGLLLPGIDYSAGMKPGRTA